MSLTDDFHAHLDTCEQCEKNPFDLCSTGDKLLRAAGNVAGIMNSFTGACVPLMTCSWYDTEHIEWALARGCRIVSICRSEPTGFQHPDHKIWEFCPSEFLLEGYKRKLVTAHEFRTRYVTDLVCSGNFDAGIKQLKAGDVLCCWEKEGDFCHRQLLAALLTSRNFEVEVH
jgi:hypothetical protein